MKYTKIPALKGYELKKLLEKDGWVESGFRRHGTALIKKFGNRTRATIIPLKKGSIPPGTLSDILGPKQTKLGKKGLLELLNKYR